MTFSELTQAVEEAEHTTRLFDQQTTKLAELLIGRLRTIRSWSDRDTLVRLKRELHGFNARYRTWEEEA